MFGGPSCSETDNFLNPYLYYRLNVKFINGGTTYVVPGYFAADGNAAESGATSGNKWKVHFAPDKTSTWTWEASFRKGNKIAASLDDEESQSLSPIDGTSGSFEVQESDKTGIDLRAKKRLEYLGTNYLRFAETGEYFIKGGADAPENFLVYDDDDNTPNYKNYRKSLWGHASDWNSGDPSWKSGNGTEIIGAINYLVIESVNVFSFLTMNIIGDNRNVFTKIDKVIFIRI